MPKLVLMGAAGGLLGLGAARALWRKNDPRIVVLPNADATASPPAAEPGLTIVSREAWGALPIDHNARNERGHYESNSNPYGWYVYAGDLSESYQTLVIHHSAFYKENGLATVHEVQRLHRHDRGWADVGYHFMVDAGGLIYAGRSLSVRGAHTAGHNTGSAGVCLMGDFRYHAPTMAQWDAFIVLSRWLAGELQLTHLAGHSQFNAGTACPGDKVREQLPAIASLLGLAFGRDGYVPSAWGEAGCACCQCLRPM